MQFLQTVFFVCFPVSRERRELVRFRHRSFKMQYARIVDRGYRTILGMFEE